MTRDEMAAAIERARIDQGLRDEIAQLRATIARVQARIEALHQQSQDKSNPARPFGQCVVCRDGTYPCHTVRLLRAALDRP